MSDDLIPSEDMGIHISRMWQHIGRTLQNLATEQAAAANSAADAYQATEIAKLAEGCFWQSTGDAASFDLERTKKDEGICERNLSER